MNGRPLAIWPIAVLGAIVLVFGVGGCMFGVPAFNRYQKRADASNRVKVNHINIRYLDQQKSIEKRKADIRVIHAVGIRKAQDEIQATLTPLYVQFEMVHALQAIAESGQNSSVVFVPTGNGNGLPIVPGLTENVGRGAVPSK